MLALLWRPGCLPGKETESRATALIVFAASLSFPLFHKKKNTFKKDLSSFSISLHRRHFDLCYYKHYRWLSSVTAVSSDDVTVSQYSHFNDPETETAQCSSAVSHLSFLCLRSSFNDVIESVLTFFWLLGMWTWTSGTKTTWATLWRWLVRWHQNPVMTSRFSTSPVLYYTAHTTPSLWVWNSSLRS